MSNEKRYEILDKEAVKKYLANLSFPIYFLDFEAITNSKMWMYEHGLAIDQQISSFSILRIEKLNDDETKIKHFNFVGEKEDYALMAKKLGDFYKDKDAPVIVWGQDLELKAVAKLIRSSNESLHKKLSSLLANILDLQQLFFAASFIKLQDSTKCSLDIVAKEFGTYLETKIKNGKKAHFILQSALNKDKNKDKAYLGNVSRRIQDYNNSDVINMKRILDVLIKEVELDI